MKGFVRNSCILSGIAIGRRPNVFYYFFLLLFLEKSNAKNSRCAKNATAHYFGTKFKELLLLEFSQGSNSNVRRTGFEFYTFRSTASLHAFLPRRKKNCRLSICIVSMSDKLLEGRYPPNKLSLLCSVKKYRMKAFGSNRLHFERNCDWLFKCFLLLFSSKKFMNFLLCRLPCRQSRISCGNSRINPRKYF